MENINDNWFIFISKKIQEILILLKREWILYYIIIEIVESDEFVDINMFENLYKYTYNNNIDIVRLNKKNFFQFKIIIIIQKIFNSNKFKNNFIILPSFLNTIIKIIFYLKINLDFFQIFLCFIIDIFLWEFFVDKI